MAAFTLGNAAATHGSVARATTAEVIGGGTAASVAPVTSAAPTDPEFAAQWHFSKLGNIQAIWQDYTGKGIHVGVYDSGVQYSNPDLAANYNASLEVTINGFTYDGDYRPVSGGHGTSVAGLIAAARDGQGTVGIAYDSTITGVNIFDPYSGGGINPGIYINADDRPLFYQAMFQRTKFDVVNDSWGQTTPGYSSELSRGVGGTESWYVTQTVQYAAEHGRGGLGTIQVTAAGNNSVDAQGDSSHTDRHWISVGAYRQVDGLASNYSSRGASLLISAPSNDLAVIGGTGIVTTDLLGRDGYNLSADPGGSYDYTDDFGGTSAASPIVAGVTTLMLDANAGLGWRDVSTILATSAKLPVDFNDRTRYLDYTDADGTGQARMNESHFVITGSDNAVVNGGGLHYSTDYGYGAVDAYAAVRMAEVWSLFGNAKTSANEVHYQSATFSPELTSGGNTYYDNTTAWDSFTGKQVSYSFNITDANIDLENVDMTIAYTSLIDFTQFNLPGLYDYNLSSTRFKLTAPDGTSAFVDTLQSAGADSSDEQSYTFGFRNFLGANPLGTWTLEIEALGGSITTVHDLTLDLYGGSTTANDLYSYTNEFFTMAAVDGQQGRQTLADTNGGTDWINAAAVSSDVSLSLVQGAQTVFGGKTAFTIAQGTTIENAVTGDGNDTLVGNDAANTLYGMRGSDTLSGGFGADTLYGNQSNDVLYGNQGADTLYGGKGEDTLYGGQDNDALFGNLGNDILQGGKGADTLTGGDGADTFRYVLTADSLVGSSDTITDFQSGTDKVDLTGIWSGTADRFVISYTLGDALLDVDLGGDGVEDMEIRLAGATGFSATDVLWNNAAGTTGSSVVFSEATTTTPVSVADYMLAA